ncbi:MAG: hypothetical protein S4CHLAM81_06420 [Chlamydiales bacterium]|nr:hypothetical protein [Chlamydiales bacterium]MCH9635426.1 hypothetical protein [Chlamydiales bacterium]
MPKGRILKRALPGSSDRTEGAIDGESSMRLYWGLEGDLLC